MKYICKECGKECNCFPSAKKIFCNKKCYGKWKSKNWSNPWNRGLKGFRTNGSFKKGQIAWNKGKENLYAKNLPQSFKYNSTKEEKNCNWKGGISLHKRIINRKDVIEWRKHIFKRDNYTCQKCGQIGGKLEGHHIKCWNKYHNLRFDINNGITLCIKCHRLYKRDLDGEKCEAVPKKEPDRRVDIVKLNYEQRIEIETTNIDKGNCITVHLTPT